MSTTEEQISAPVSAPPETPTPAAPATPIQPSAPPVPAAPPAPPKNETRIETLRRVASEPQKETNRGKHAQFQPREQGKFAGAPQSPATPTPAPSPTPAPVRPDMPKSLKLELKEHWEKTPLEIMNAIHQREADFEKGVTPLKEKARFADAITAQFEPYKMLLAAEGATPEKAIAPLLQTAALFRVGTPIQKAQAVAQLIRQFAIPNEVVQQILGGQAPAQPAFDPQFQQVNQLAQQVQQLTQLQQQTIESNAIAEITAFASDPAHKHFAAVEDRMAVLLQNPTVLGPDVSAMPSRAKLQLAYETACRLDPAVAQQIAAEQLAARPTPKPSVQVTGAPASPVAPPINPQDRRALISHLMSAQR